MYDFQLFFKLFLHDNDAIFRSSAISILFDYNLYGSKFQMDLCDDFQRIFVQD